jgi:PRC-barrel domain
VSEDAGAPVSWLLIERGWKVVDSGGKDLGHVEEVVGDSGEDIFNGLTVAHGVLGKPRYVPAERVAEIKQGLVRLSIGEGDLRHLDEFEPPPPSERLRP